MMGGGAPPLPGQGAEAVQQQLTQTVGQIREIGNMVQALGASNPMLAQSTQQIMQILKQMVVQAASVTPQQTMSGAMVPGSGGS